MTTGSASQFQLLRWSVERDGLQTHSNMRISSLKGFAFIIILVVCLNLYFNIGFGSTLSTTENRHRVTSALRSPEAQFLPDAIGTANPLPQSPESVEIVPGNRLSDEKFLSEASSNSIRGSNGLRTICTLMQNETAFVREWLDYHMALGWNKIVIYDDKSTDGTPEYVRQQYPQNMVEVISVSWPTPAGRYGFTKLQEIAFADCFSKFWNASSVLINLDVDEFIHPAEPFWGKEDPLMHAFKAADYFQPNKSILVGYQLMDFGFGDYIARPNASVALSYTRRMPVTEQEVKSFTLGQLDKLPTPGKVLYFPNGGREVIVPSVHHPAEGWKYPQMPQANFYVNHYRFRSHDDIAKKFLKNKYGGSLTKLPKDHPTFQYYSWIFEDRIIRFVRSVLGSLCVYNSTCIE